MAVNISFVNKGDYLFEVREKEEGHWLRRPVSADESSTSEDEVWGSTDNDSFHETSGSELEDMAFSYTRNLPPPYKNTERNHLEAPALPEKWKRAGPWEGSPYLKVEDGANDRGFMEPMEQTRPRRNNRLSRFSFSRSAFDRSGDDDDDMREYYEFFDWADKEWTESFAGRSKEEILERDLFRGNMREWTPPELKARFGVPSKVYLMRLLRRRKLVMCDGEAFDAMVSRKAALKQEWGDEYDDEEEGGFDGLLKGRRDGRTDWGHMTEAEQDAFSTALAQDEVGMCKVSCLCDLPEFEGFPHAAFVPLSPTREEFEPRTP
ncbi:hypothetical protein PG993_010405 [Apiospora rasikravindrae]|uniref:Uncharacterized protein n=1 Tax=Apiospora rasikravindrae TaxID=990691 RepID=A0ABR1SM57_9PEZI